MEVKKTRESSSDEFFHNFDQSIIDDETFVRPDIFQLPGQELYVADARGNVAEKYRVSKKRILKISGLIRAQKRPIHNKILNWKNSRKDRIVL